MTTDDEIKELEKNLQILESTNNEKWKTVFSRLAALSNRVSSVDQKTHKLEEKLVKIAGTLIIFLLGVVISLMDKLLEGY
jgi:hypothetical protein